MEVQEFIVKVKDMLFETSSTFGPATVLQDLDGWDSLGRLSLVAMLHESFGTMVDTKSLLEFQTVGDIIALIQDRLKG